MQVRKSNLKVVLKTQLAAKGFRFRVIGDLRRKYVCRPTGLACSCLNFEAACTGTPQPDPRSHARPEWNSVKIYGGDACMSSFAALYLERGEAQARPSLSSKAAN